MSLPICVCVCCKRWVEQLSEIMPLLEKSLEICELGELPSACGANDLRDELKAMIRKLNPSEVERLAEAERRLGAEVRCDCGVPGCNKLFDHRKGGSGFFG
jgi:hypothetical protein